MLYIYTQLTSYTVVVLELAALALDECNTDWAATCFGNEGVPGI